MHTKIAPVALALALGLILAVSPLVVSAQSTDPQALIAQLTAQVQALMAQIQALQDGSSASISAQCLDLTHSFGPDYTDSTTGGEVTKLQIFFVSQGLLNGSLPHGYFGPATLKALQQWQAQHSIVSSGTPKSTGYGFIGPKTRKMMGCGATFAPVQTPQDSSMTQSPVIPAALVPP